MLVVMARTVLVAMVMMMMAWTVMVFLVVMMALTIVVYPVLVMMSCTATVSMMKVRTLVSSIRVMTGSMVFSVVVMVTR